MSIYVYTYVIPTYMYIYIYIRIYTYGNTLYYVMLYYIMLHHMNTPEARGVELLCGRAEWWLRSVFKSSFMM